MAPFFNVITLDLRNHCQSPHAREMGYEHLAADVLHFMDKHGLVRANLLGHSMGGKAAMQLALENPMRAESLVVADIAPVRYSHRGMQQKIINALSRLDLKKLSSRQDADDVLSKNLPNAKLRGFLLQNLVTRNGIFAWKINLDAIESGLQELAEPPVGYQPFRGPALFIGGTESTYLREQHFPEIQRLFPQYRVVMLENCGHWLHVDKPGLFKNTVIEFLGQKMDEPDE